MDQKIRTVKPLPANLYRRGGPIWGRLKVDGREHRSSLRTSNAREAKIRLAAWRTELERQAVTGAESPVFKGAVVKWVAEVVPGAVKPSVMRRYLTSIAVLEPTFGAMRVADITERTISKYISSRDGKVTNATLRRDITALSKLLSACILWGWIDRNPAKFYDRSNIKEQRRTLALPVDQDIENFLALAPARMVPLLRFQAATGMRENEAVTLVASNIVHEARTITLTLTKSSRPRRLSWATLGDDATEILAPLAERTGLLFPNRDGTEYQNIASNFGQVMRDAARRAEDEGVPFTRWRAHDLRHRFAVWWLQAGGDIYRLSRHLGHSSVKTTEIYLDHLTSDELDAIRDVALVAQKGGTAPSGTTLTS
jgi:integrase